MIESGETFYKQLVTAGMNDDLPSAVLRHRVHQAVSKAPGMAGTGRRRIRLWQAGAIAAAFGAIVLGGLGVWSRDGVRPDSKGKWWLGPPAAWAQEIDVAIARAKAVACREQFINIDTGGQRQTSSTWNLHTVGRDSYRRDIYDGDKLREIQWYTPEREGMLQTAVCFDVSCYCVLRHGGGFDVKDPVKRMRELVRLAAKAGRKLDLEVVEGRECIGFEIPPDQLKPNPDRLLCRIWVDVESRLPLRIEWEPPAEGMPVGKAWILVQDRFDYEPVLNADTFEPNIPAGFVKVGHPDELRRK
ncbi:MAG: hypothetical protein JXQ73_25815 [Phycisphaerae bacterium]|nr:hypothetical protein [Phycisphaerae bacterium]